MLPEVVHRGVGTGHLWGPSGSGSLSGLIHWISRDFFDGTSVRSAHRHAPYRSACVSKGVRRHPSRAAWSFDMSPDPKPRKGHSRAILGVVLSNRYAGHACLDGFGLVHRDVEPFGTWNLRHASAGRQRVTLLETKLVRAIARYRPSLVVLAVTRRGLDELRLLDAAVRTCMRLAARFVVAPAYDGMRALGWRTGRTLISSVRMLCRHFTPELTAKLPPDGAAGSLGARWRYRRVSWLATTLALRELARVRPWSAVALVRDRPPRCPLLDELERVVLVTDPMTTPAL